LFVERRFKLGTLIATANDVELAAACAFCSVTCIACYQLTSHVLLLLLLLLPRPF
jgi:hypothetical protein